MEKLKWVCEQRLRDSWDSTNLSFEKDRAYGFSWPQRSYRCSFCKKEFKSAQALGGHMNVHRRDRARMRLSPSCEHVHSPNNPNPNPNPNPSFSSSSSSAKFLPYNMGAQCQYSSFNAAANSPSLAEKGPALFGGSDMGKKKKKGVEFELTSFGTRKDGRVWKGNREFVRLDLKLGLINQDVKEDLDLELRLGCSN